MIYLGENAALCNASHGKYGCDEYKQKGKLLSLKNTTFNLSRKCAAQSEASLGTL